jgi:hypothetical protein
LRQRQRRIVAARGGHYAAPWQRQSGAFIDAGAMAAAE